MKIQILNLEVRRENFNHLLFHFVNNIINLIYFNNNFK